tara:strand:- start:1274 stop:2383 length:1110 start_codon:yes stop_codon:yes gene_type:complete
MNQNFIDALIIGGGVIGLAIAKTISQKGMQAIVVEDEDTIGSITSSRNSGVIHAGVYYDSGSLKARFCAEGNRKMYEYCKRFYVPHLNTGKFIVATTKNEIPILDSIRIKAEDNGVKGIERVSGTFVTNKEPLIKCEEALFVPSSGIVDQGSLMRSYLGEFEDQSGNVAFKSKFIKSILKNDNHVSTIRNGSEEITIESRILINAAGLRAEQVAKNIDALDKKYIPKTYFAKGNYFETGKDLKIRHLIYPIPNEASLGLHLGLDMGMQVRFGPDVEWVEELNYDVNNDRLESFYNDIKKYLPSIDKSILRVGYSGIRPKLKNKGEGKSDFNIQDETVHGIKNLVNLYGMESPGLTSSLVIGDFVSDLIC